MWLVILSRVHLVSPRLPLLWPSWGSVSLLGNTHTYRLTHTSWTHRVMMGLSSSIRACSSRLRSRAESVELDSSQEVFSHGFVAAWPVCFALQAAERSVKALRCTKLIYCSVSRISVSSYTGDTAPTMARVSPQSIINPFFGHSVVSLMIIMWLRWKNKGIRWINDWFCNVTWFMGSVVINGHLIQPESNFSSKIYFFFIFFVWHRIYNLLGFALKYYISWPVLITCNSLLCIQFMRTHCVN